MVDNKTIRILIVDDHQVVRQGFAVFLKTFPDLLLVGEAADGEEALRLCGEVHPDVVLMDIIMPHMDGVTATRLIRQQYPNIKVVAFTSYTDNRHNAQKALQAGATGYLFKDVSISELAQAIRSVHDGVLVLTPEVSQLLMQASAARAQREFNLSDREREILALLVTGLSNAQIAQRLSVSRSAIKFHVSSILGKLGATSRTEAVTIAHQYKLLP
ncbi:MAG: response regulator transcription factor [Chloroflexi bacterium]|nr:response regulator transcription factor [Chloroflexota bacterium]